MSPVEEKIRIADLLRRIDHLTPSVRNDGWLTYTRLVSELTDRIAAQFPSPEWKKLNLGIHHKLPCGCMGADIKSSQVYRITECQACGRGWWHSGVRGWGCTMLDGKPQGEPVLILSEKMVVDSQDESSYSPSNSNKGDQP